MNKRPISSAAVWFLLPVSAVSAQTLSPANRVHDVNPDVQLKLTFHTPPGIGTAGKVHIYDAANDRLVDTLDLSIPSGPTERAAGAALTAPYLTTPYNYERPVIPTNANTKPGTPSAGAQPTSDKYQLTIIGGFTAGFHFCPIMYPIMINGNPATIQEIVSFRNKDTVTFLGEDRDQTRMRCLTVQITPQRWRARVLPPRPLTGRSRSQLFRQNSLI